jgi:phosphatidylglycerol lysyltransferase
MSRLNSIVKRMPKLQKDWKPDNEWNAELKDARRWVDLVAWFVAAVGLIDVLEGLIPREPRVIEWMAQFLPMDVSESSRLGMYLTGFFLLAIARGIWRRKRAAWWLAVILLSVTTILQFARGTLVHHIFLSLTILGLLIWRRRDYVASSDRPSMRWALIVGLPFLCAVILYGVVGILRLRGEVVGKNNFRAAMQTTLELIFLQSTDSQIATTPRAANFFIQVSAGGMLSGFIMVLFLLRPVLQRAFEPEHDDSLIRKIIDRYGCDPLDEFALLPDKSYWVSDDQQSFIAYSLWRNIAVCLVGPVGPPGVWPAATHEFLRYCSVQDWEPVFYPARGELRSVFDQCGLKSFKIGEDARLSITDFNLKGNRFQNLRTARNKARKEGKTFRWYQPGDGAIDYGLEAQLKLLSDEWLKRKQGRQMTFDLGSFDLPKIRQEGAAAVFTRDGKLEAFATWLPFRQGKGRCLDLMRSYAEAKGVMDFLIVESIDFFKGLGVEEVSLGNAPLANADEKLYGREEKAVRFLFERFNRYYGYKSLYEFKKKYHPEWQGRYVGFQPKVNLLLAMVALVRVHLPEGLVRMLWS